MGAAPAGRAPALYVPGDSVVHALPSHCKLVALVAFVLLVVATPRTVFWAFAVYAGLLAVVAALGRIRALLIGRRMLVEVPFVVFAVLLPFVASGPRVEVLGVWLSEPGLLGGWNVLAKATLGVVASILLAATTEHRALLAALERLRLPGQLVQITGFMIRYVDVIGDQLHRMRMARTSRGFLARDPRSWRVLAATAGTLFIRSYERGERVHLAMLARGYDPHGNQAPQLSGEVGSASMRQWMCAAALPGAALAVLAGAWVTG